MKKNIIVILSIVSVILLVAVAGFLVNKNKHKNPNEQAPEVIETPPSISKVNSLPLSKRPFVNLIPHSNPSRCNGVDLIIKDLKNNETEAEYELEYTTTKLIQGVFGTRTFSDSEEKHDPLEFGTCSKGRCKCDDDITGGSLKLSFIGDEEYVLKSDFNVQNVGENEGLLNSKDARLDIDVNQALSNSDNVLIMNTFGIPGELKDKIILGPYGIFAEGISELKSPIKVTLKSKDVQTGKIQFYDGKTWSVIQADINGNQATFELNKLGIIALTE